MTRALFVAFALSLGLVGCVAEEISAPRPVSLPLCPPKAGVAPVPSPEERAKMAVRPAPAPAPTAAPAPTPSAAAPPPPPPAPKRLAIKPTESAQKCGEKNKPCPLQAWMRVNIAAFSAAEDGPGLARGLERSAELSPDPSWDWAAIARAGAAAAKAGDFAGASKSCRSCHDKYKNLYKEKYRSRAVR